MLALLFMIFLSVVCLKAVFFGFKVLFMTSGTLFLLVFFIPAFVITMILFWGLFFFIIPLLIAGFIICSVIKAIA